MNKNPEFWIREDLDHAVFITHGPTVICQLIGENREEYAEIVRAALEGIWAVNPDNPVAAAGELPGLVEACEEAEQIIKTARQYFPKSMRNADAFALENTCATVTAAIANAKRGE